ncbi:hypothetical protein PGT21_030188 [Puccinia graminis f. sp. tritici]|uniref:Uncharacterized protein n=1 Tax=Puccinia graminis f. sp. tritici TaxID=56615 RepID=A0A5B0MIF1_PUCGR|nr:hypothetical protein PGTUg99_029109 [Puccinia graminis f. sp. tritici]KAA1091281.1 hypothetical protein PGT21_030188 [Puccinia graminis f. sp. tritici]
MHDDSVKGASLPAADRERTEPRGASYYRNRRSLLPNRPEFKSRYRVFKFEDWIGIEAENCKKVTRMATPVGHLFQVWVAKCGIATQFSDPRGDALTILTGSANRLNRQSRSAKANSNTRKEVKNRNLQNDC